MKSLITLCLSSLFSLVVIVTIPVQLATCYSPKLHKEICVLLEFLGF